MTCKSQGLPAGFIAIVFYFLFLFVTVSCDAQNNR